MIHVQDAEDFFRADEYLDATAARRPVIYISPNDIYSTHSIISDNLDVIVRCPVLLPKVHADSFLRRRTLKTPCARSLASSAASPSPPTQNSCELGPTRSLSP